MTQVKRGAALRSYYGPAAVQPGAAAPEHDMAVSPTLTPDAAPQPSTPPDAQAFRAAMGMLPTGVTIVTARSEDGTPVGLTVNSFNSVSLDPPLVLWCLATAARSLPVFMRARHFAVHVLDAGQQALAERFARKGTDRWEGLTPPQGLGGVPLIEGVAACFECVQHSAVPAGDHVILLGEVLACRHVPGRAPLLFHGGSYYTERAI